jgi:FtsH-binding integral membrane protein
MAYLVAYVLAIFAIRGQEHIVMVAAVITAAMIVGLTIYAFISSDDLTYLIGFVFILASTAMIVGIISLFKWNPFL